MRTFEQIIEDASVKEPFDNGYARESWMDAWCYRCTHNATDCPLIDAAFFDYTPKEWADGSIASLTQRYRCAEFIPGSANLLPPKWRLA